MVFLGAYAVTLQSSIPDISSKKTYENCIRSFNGFPLHENNDLSFLIYVICVTSFLAKQKSRPWKYLKLGNKKKIEKKNK